MPLNVCLSLWPHSCLELLSHHWKKLSPLLHAQWALLWKDRRLHPREHPASSVDGPGARYADYLYGKGMCYDHHLDFGMSFSS